MIILFPFHFYKLQIESLGEEDCRFRRLYPTLFYISVLLRTNLIVQRSLLIATAIVEQIGGVLGESGLLVLPSVAADVNQVLCLNDFLLSTVFVGSHHRLTYLNEAVISCLFLYHPCRS